MKSLNNMSRNLYQWITSPIIWGVWLYVAISGVRGFIQTSKVKGMSLWMTKKDLENTKDPEVHEAVRLWKRKIRRLFFTWLLTAVIFMILSAIIEGTIGFKD